uniref:Uncharacterized protein n=1 Tax=Cannabis sativa TaxID=3483 RepID=A0A803NLU6_CANSA
MARARSTRTRSTTRGASDHGNCYSVLDQEDRLRPNIDPRSPYFLSNADNPSATLVPKILTGVENYSS